MYIYIYLCIYIYIYIYEGFTFIDNQEILVFCVAFAKFANILYSRTLPIYRNFQTPCLLKNDE